MRAPWNDLGTLGLVIIVVFVAEASFLGGYIIGIYYARPNVRAYFFFSQSFHFWPPVYITVSPMSYPSLGQSWTIYVYDVEVVSNRATLSPLANSVVIVNVLSTEGPYDYNVRANSDGQVLFPYLPSYKDVAFQAFAGNLSSQKIIISTHYVSPVVIDGVLEASGFVSGLGLLGGGIAFRRKEIRKVFRILLLALTSLSAIVTFLALYLKLFQVTPWGYPENIVGGILSTTLLRYLSISTAVSLFLCAIFAFWTRIQGPAEAGNAPA